MYELLDLTALRKAVQSLHKALSVLQNKPWFEAQCTVVKEMLLTATIKNFELVYEMCIKTLKRQIECDAIVPDQIDLISFRDLLRIAAEKTYIQDVEKWFTYRKMRNTTTHTYNEEKTQQIYSAILTFADDAQDLLSRWEKRNGT